MEHKITRKDYEDYLKSLFSDVTAEELSGKAIESYKYLAKNYSNLTDEMKALADQMMDGFVEHVYESLKDTTDDKEARQIRRMARSLKYKFPTATGLLTSIESKAQHTEPILDNTRTLFEKYFHLYLDFLYDIAIEDSHSGIKSYAQLSVLFSCVDELVAGIHLAQHGFVNQAYTHVRTIYESLNKLELFIRDESYAVLWMSDDEKRKAKELKPYAVRQKLGIKDDPLYSFFSAHGPHVTKEYMRSKTIKKTELSKKGNPEIMVFLGGTKVFGHILWANIACIMAIFGALVYLGKAFPDRLNAQDYATVLDNLVNDFKIYLNQCIKIFSEAGLDTTELQEFLNKPDFMSYVAGQMQDSKR